jgi:FMN reductase
MRIAVVSCSLNPTSRSRILANTALAVLKANADIETDFLDLAQIELPLCDGASAYGHPNVALVKDRLSRADGILMSVPIYNFDVNSAAKNLIELTGKHVWVDKVAAFACAAGGQGSYMSIMALANSLMLDFRTLIIPRFVYATGKDFADDGTISSETVRERVEELAGELVRVTQCVSRVNQS